MAKLFSPKSLQFGYLLTVEIIDYFNEIEAVLKKIGFDYKKSKKSFRISAALFAEKRKLIDQDFGWANTVGRIQQ